VRFDIEAAAVPMADGVEAVCEAVDLDPWAVTSCGTLLLTVDPTDSGAVVAALRAQGTPAAIVGSVSEGEGVSVDGERRRPPDADPSWAVYRDLAE
jgi:hydrogenase expression/formation protein HypE